jgi:hypothetical protein
MPIERHERLDRLFSDSVRVAHVMEPLKSWPLETDAQDLKRELTDLDFDYAAVEDSSGLMVGYVSREDLDKRSGPLREEHLKPVLPLHLVSEELALQELFQMMAEVEPIFVLSGRSVTGIVTLWDLFKPAGRFFAFGQLSLLETLLKQDFHVTFDCDEMRDFLSAKRGQATDELHKRLTEDGLVRRWVDSLQFCDLRDICWKGKRPLVTTMGMKKREWMKFMETAEYIRNNIAHAGEVKGDYQQLVEAILNTRRAVEALLKQASGA